MSVLRERRFWDLFAASFGALFFELLLVRWLPTEIYYLGYYKNCILFATFLGYGIGCATHYRFESDRTFHLVAASQPLQQKYWVTPRHGANQGHRLRAHARPRTC